MNAPRCSACDRFAIVEIEEGFFLCRRCEVILCKQFPDTAKRAKSVASTETATSETTELPADAPTSGAADTFPPLPDFLARVA